MIRPLLLLLLLLVGMAQAQEAIRLAPGLAVQKLPQDLTPAGPWPAAPGLCLSRAGLWFVGGDNVWRIGNKQTLLTVPLPIDDFACSEAGTPVIVAAGRLGPVQNGLFIPRLPLPSAQTRLAGGAGDSLILFETAAPARLFRFDGRQAQLVATLAEPIHAVAPAGDFIVVATPSGIYRVRAGDPLGLLLPLEDMPPVRSLAVHPRTAEILFSTADEIFLLDDKRATQIAAGLGGTLLPTAQEIFVADPRHRGIFRLSSRPPR
jgi:hypothetical protein